MIVKLQKSEYRLNLDDIKYASSLDLSAEDPNTISLNNSKIVITLIRAIKRYPLFGNKLFFNKDFNESQ